MTDGVLDDRYRLGTLLGRGGMGEVWRAHDTRIGREVAVKIVTAGGLTAEALARFDREARIAGTVSGPSIVTVHDYGHDEYAGQTVPYLVMELVAGRTVADRVRTDGPPDPRTALTWSRHICQALAAAHAANVVHRDIKPSNVMVADNGTLKVLDFGIARFMEHQHTRTGLTAAGMVIGSAEYMSPEQAQGQRVDARSDLYSLGCLLFFTLTGRTPFEADSAVGLAYQHVNKAPEPPSRYRTGIPPEVDALVLELMAKDPAARPGDAETVGTRIDRLLAAAATTVSGAGPAPGVGGTAAGFAAAAAAGEMATGRGTAVGATAGPTAPAGPALGGAPAGRTVPGHPTGPWIPHQENQPTEVRHYPEAPPPGPQSSRRWFLTGAAVVVAGGAGLGTWLAVGDKSSPRHDAGSTRLDNGLPSSSATSAASAPTGKPSSSPSTTPSTPATPATPAASTPNPAPHNPIPASVLTGHGGDVVHVAFRSDSRLLASCSFDHTARLWDVSDPLHPQFIRACRQHTDQVWNVAVSPDGHTLATSSLDQSVILWDIRDPSSPTVNAQVKLGNKLNGVAFSPDGEYLAVGTWGGTVRLIDLSRPTDQAAIRTLSGHTGLVYSVAYSSDGTLLASGSFDKTVVLWDVRDPSAAKQLGVSRLHQDRVFDLAFQPGGRLLAAGSADRSLILLDVSDPARPAAAAVIPEDDEATGVAFSPDGRTVATGCGAGAQIRLADVSTPTTPHVFDPLTGHKGYTYGVAYSPDGRLLASGSGDKSIRLWRF